MIQGLSSSVGSYLSSAGATAPQSIASTQTSASDANQSVITIERGNSVYKTYLRNGVVQKLQYVGSSLSKTF